ncbi:MAG: synthase subunit epsilon, F-type H+-transporting ATPase subunit epsilon [Candidatus Parcubacteria bacterium]|jgi:F-type H+-transporting ATPase subunit epsilon
MKKIIFKIITPEKIVFEGEVQNVTLPVKEGEVTILPEHVPYIASLKAGEVIIRSDSEEPRRLAVSGGFVEFHDNTLVLLADTAENAKDLDLERAEEAKKRAQELKNQASENDEEYGRLVAMLEKETIRVHIARKHGISHKKTIFTDN